MADESFSVYINTPVSEREYRFSSIFLSWAMNYLTIQYELDSIDMAGCLDSELL